MYRNTMASFCYAKSQKKKKKKKKKRSPCFSKLWYTVTLWLVNCNCFTNSYGQTLIHWVYVRFIVAPTF
jgi:hypothetical protein